MKKYLMENRLGIALLHAIDKVLPNLRQAQPPALPASLLISNLAHIGDGVLMTSILRMLKESLPDLKIGVLCGSWNKPIFTNHPCVDNLHLADHWKLNRSEISRFNKYKIHRSSFSQALQEITRVGYGAAVDLYPFFPNSIPLLWKAKIPVRVGYESGGFGPVLTHSIPTVDLKISSGENGRLLLQKFFDLPQVSFSGRPFLTDAGLPPSLLQGKNYFVLHMGTGYSLKEWPEDKWRQLATALSQRGDRLVFTGRGKVEKERIERVIRGLENAWDFCDKVDWKGFTSLIAHAQALISVDSVSVHVASAFEIPTVVIYSGINPISFWNSGNPNSQNLMRPLPCAPCLDRRGCASMSCIRDIHFEEVMQAIGRIV